MSKTNKRPTKRRECGFEMAKRKDLQLAGYLPKGVEIIIRRTEPEPPKAEPDLSEYSRLGRLHD
jgi:hypothetical protein